MKRSIFIIYLFVIILSTACSSEQFISSEYNSSAVSHLVSIDSSDYASLNLMRSILSLFRMTYIHQK